MKVAQHAVGPTLVARHELRRELARGGLGVVYLAYHPDLDALRAIKRPLLQNIADRALTLGRFKREMQAVGGLRNNHVVGAYDAGEDGDGPYLVMEYLDGEAMSNLMARHRRLPFPEACEVIRQAALGLQAAHERGLVHRDIKPSNLMLARSSAGSARTVVIDWGLVKRQGEADGPANRLTKISMEMGTPDFVSPDQIRDPHTVDIRADIYSLGATLYCFLAGQPPFHGRTVDQKLIAQAKEEFPPLERLRPDLPANVLAVVNKMVKKNPAERYQTPGEVAAALQPFGCAESHRLSALLAPVSSEKPVGTETDNILDKQTELAPRPGPTDRSDSQRRRKRTILWLAASAGLLMVLSTCILLSVIGFGMLRKEDPKGDGLVANGKEAKEKKEPLWLVPQPKGPVLVGEKEGFLEPALNCDHGWCLSLAFMPDGVRAVWNAGSALHVWDLKNHQKAREPVPLFLGEQGHPQPGLVSLSADGNRLSTSSYVNILGFDGTKFQKAPDQPLRVPNFCTGIAFSPDGKTLAVAESGAKGRVSFWDSMTWVPEDAENLLFDVPVSSLGYSPKGDYLVVTTGGVDFRSVSEKLGRTWFVSDRRISVWSVKDRKRVKDLKNPKDIVDVPSVAAFFADGKRIFSASPADAKLRVWSWDDADKENLGKELKSIQAGPDLVAKGADKDRDDTKQMCCVAFWPWGRALTGYRHGGIKLWDLETGAMLGAWPGSVSKQPNTFVTALAISPDGHHALVARSDFLVYLYRLPPPQAKP